MNKSLTHLSQGFVSIPAKGLILENLASAPTGFRCVVAKNINKWDYGPWQSWNHNMYMYITHMLNVWIVTNISPINDPNVGKYM